MTDLFQNPERDITKVRLIAVGAPARPASLYLDMQAARNASIEVD